MTTQGIFCWHDLGTTDVERAKVFYSELLGWKVGERMGGAAYWVFEDGYNQAGGMMELPADSPHPPHWLPYVTVMDCDAAAARVVELGGQVAVGPMDIPTVGRFAVVSDDQGAWISIISMPVAPESRAADYRHGEFCWYTLSTRDLAKATAFYAALVGWDVQETDMAGAPQLIFTREGAPAASLIPVQGEQPPHWGMAVCVEGLEAALERAAGLGGHGVVPPMTLGQMGRMAVISDPAGAMLTLFEGA